MNLPEAILSRFVGRSDVHAQAGAAGDFAPRHEPITLERMVGEHLSGETCLGFYLLDAASRCRCTCVDFDSKPDKPDPEWRKKAESLYFGLVGCGLAPVVELSQSGEGCHVWLFFSEPTEAWIPRAFWRAVERRIGTHYTEIYPRQDVLTGKGLGNLVRYPLWNNSIFCDVEDGWKMVDALATLQGVTAITGTDLKLIAFQAGMGELVAEPRVETAGIIGTGDALPLRVQKLVNDGGGLLARRWRNDGTGMQDTSKSAVALSLCCELVRAYVPTPEIGAALRYWCHEHGAHEKGDRDDWVNLTVAKAYDFIISRRESKSVDVTTFRDACHAYVDMIENNTRVFVPSGIRELDESVEGVAPGEVCVIAGRPNHGKSAVAFQWLAHAATLGVKGLLISEEMGKVEIGKRRLQSIAGIPQEQWVSASAATLRRDVDIYHKSKSDVYIVESCNTIDRVEEVIDQFAQMYNVGIFAIDYLQLLGARTKDRYEVVTEVSRRVKQAARRNGVAILLLSQLNREVEKRDDHEPKMSDLRESGQVEQDADLILFTQYPCRFDANMPPDLYRIYAAKRRNGPIKSPRVETNFNPAKQIVGWGELPDAVLDL
jgi:replicative DNA helicase